MLVHRLLNLCKTTKTNVRILFTQHHIPKVNFVKWMISKTFCRKVTPVVGLTRYKVQQDKLFSKTNDHPHAALCHSSQLMTSIVAGQSLRSCSPRNCHLWSADCHVTDKQPFFTAHYLWHFFVLWGDAWLTQELHGTAQYRSSFGHRWVTGLR